VPQRDAVPVHQLLLHNIKKLEVIMGPSHQFVYIATDNPLYKEPDWFEEVFARDGLSFVWCSPRSGEAENAALLPQAKALLVGSSRYPVTAESFDRLQDCGLVVRMGAGYDTIDVAAATGHGVMVANMPANIAEDVSDHAIALFLACLRRLVPQTAAIRSGTWDPYLTYPAMRLRGQVLGLVGCGRIARKVIEKVSGFGLTCIAFDPYADPAEVKQCGAEPVTFDELLRRSDVVSIHAPDTVETRGMFDREAFAKMKPTAILINTARGALVDEPALVSALSDGRIRAAGLDVFAKGSLPPDDPLLQLDNVVLTPHVAGYSEEGLVDYFQAAHRLISDFILRGQVPESIVNPEVLDR
jgi:D-3-phosphoglycerate dehydrogenase